MDISERLVNVILRVVIYLQQIINGEPLPHMPTQETSGQENKVEQESREQRALSSKLVTLRRGSVNMQEQESSAAAEPESWEQRGLSSRLVSRRGSVNSDTTALKLTALIH